MARSRASAPKTSAPARSAAPAPAPARAPAPAAHSTAHTQSKTTPAAAPQPQVTNVYVQRGGMGGGMGGGMLGTMAAVAGGSVLGHGISNYLYGHGNQAAPTQPAEAQELAQAAQQEQHPCSPQLVGYSKCLEANPESADGCKWAWDYFQQCQAKTQPIQ